MGYRQYCRGGVAKGVENVVFEGAKTPSDNRVHNPSVGRSVAATCVYTSCYTKVPSNVFAWILVLQKKKMLLPGIYVLLLFGYPGVLFLMRRILNGKITSPQVPRPKQHRLVHLRRNEQIRCKKRQHGGCRQPQCTEKQFMGKKQYDAHGQDQNGGKNQMDVF